MLSYSKSLALFTLLISACSATPFSFLLTPEQQPARSPSSFRPLSLPQVRLQHSSARGDTAPAVYEGAGCSAASPASVRSCQEYAEQACFNPFLAPAAAIALQTAMDSGIGGSAISFTHCRQAVCEDTECDNPSESGERERCIPCLSACMRSCIANHELICLKKVCASTLGAVASYAVDSVVLAEGGKKGNTELKQLVQFQTTEAATWLKSFVQADPNGSGPGLCTEDALKAADVTVIGPAGLTYNSALVSCVKNFLAPEKIDWTSANTEIYLNDAACNVIDQCPRNNTQVAMDRANKIWMDLEAKYRAQMNK